MLQSNNDTYTLKKMLQETDKAQFIEAAQAELASMFKEEISIAVPKIKTRAPYDKQRAADQNIHQTRS